MSELKPYKRYVFSKIQNPLTYNSIIVNIKVKEEKTDYLVLEQGYTKFSYEFETTEKILLI